MTTTTAATTTTTVEQLNAARGLQRITGGEGWIYSREYRLGRSGGQNARRGTAGAKLHLLDVDVVIERPAAATARQHKLGAFASITGCTTSNGQYTGTVSPDAHDLAAVTCTRCKARLARILAALAPVVEPTSVVAPTPKRVTAATVNAELKRRGIAERLKQGRGYCYFVEGDASGWYSSSVAVCYVSDIPTVERWLDALDKLRSDSRNF